MITMGALRRLLPRLIACVLLALLLSHMAPALVVPAYAINDPAEALPDPAQEARAVRIGHQLRCLVCQNESIEDSGADLARDLRKIVRQQVAAGASDQQVIAWLVARYGNFVRLKPPFNALTALLWASPVVALLLGFGLALVGRRQRAVPAMPLSEAERVRLRGLLEP
jgi:cytochrome c-type biogenesis protein CcmH